MIDLNLKYPVIIFKEKDKMMYSYEKNLFVTTIDLIAFYKNICIIDSSGKKIQVASSKIRRNRGFSLLYLKKMIEVEPVLKNKPAYVTLEELKVKIMRHVRLKPRFWLSLDTISGIQERVDNANTYRDLIKVFR